MIHELRVYQAVPGQMAKLQARFRDHLPPIWEKHGIHCDRLLTTLVGESSNEFDLTPPVGLAGRSRSEVDCVRERPSLAQGAR